jgi:hypothetical protein
MPYYDDPSGNTRYDAPGVYYDDFHPIPESETIMAKVAMNISNKSNVEVVQFATNVHTALTGNANVPTPNPGLAPLQTLITAAETAIDAYEAEKDVLRNKKETRDLAVLAVIAALRTEADTVQSATGGDAAKILSTGFDIKSHPSPVGIPPQVTGLKVAVGADEGTLRARWTAVRGAMSYVIQTSLDPVTPTSWVNKALVTRAFAVVNSFSSGTKVWLRVRAVGAAGEGEASDAVARIVQ